MDNLLTKEQIAEWKLSGLCASCGRDTNANEWCPEGLEAGYPSAIKDDNCDYKKKWLSNIREFNVRL